jgi:cellulose synthase/poly-beta-1,6-N-acetylglucosamine synthase-like glycosyltransferase
VILSVLCVLAVPVGVLVLIRTVALSLLASRRGRERWATDRSWGPVVTEPVSVVVPAYNEKEGIAAAVRSLARGDHPGGIDVVVVDDGSTDGTADIVRRLALPNVRLVCKPNGGKPSALNAGVALARHDLVVMVDADTLLEPGSVRRLVQPFSDPTVGAVAGNVKVGNLNSVVARWQHIEYVAGFNLDRRLYDMLGCMPTVPGAIGAFRRTALEDVGGVSDDTLAEDTDLTMALLRADWRVVYEDRARAWTEVPATLRQLRLQRHRWNYGTVQAMWKHHRSIVEQGAAGRFGRLGLPILTVFGMLLPVLAPLVDITAMYGLLGGEAMWAVAGWLALSGLQLATALVAFRLDRERMVALWALPLQQVAYRYLMCLVLIHSGLSALTGRRLRWHKLNRSGLGDAVGTPPAVHRFAGTGPSGPRRTASPDAADARGSSRWGGRPVDQDEKVR